MTYNLNDKSLLFKKISIQLQNDFDSTLKVSDTYTLELAKCIYNYLSYKYSDVIKNKINELISAQSEYLSSELSEKIEYKGRLIDIIVETVADTYLSGVKLYKDITLNPESVPLDEHLYDRNTSAVGYEYQTDIKSINEITKYNIAFWPISDNVLQYVIDNSVITPLSSLEDIATMQKLLYNISSFNYNYDPGMWDTDFSRACYLIQLIAKESDDAVILTGLCDLCVEKYLRSHNEIRSSSYGH